MVVFIDYLTKWVESFAVQDQSAETIARLLVFCRHGVPEQLLSDCGANFLSNLFKMMRVKKVNTSGYYPQTDWLVEKMNSTIITVIQGSQRFQKRLGSTLTLHLVCLSSVNTRINLHRKPILPVIWERLVFQQKKFLPSHHPVPSGCG